MPEPGDVVTVDFQGAMGIKRRPAVVISSRQYHTERPDLILGILTTNIRAASSSMDYALLDWQSAGLRAASVFRCYFGMALPANVRVFGHLSDRDWKAVQDRIQRALSL